jgi:predicted HTH domain antitoxin
MHTYTLTELPQHRTDVLNDSQSGKLAVVIDEGRPIFLAVPFDDAMVKRGLNLDLAIKLYDEEVLSLGRAAELAGMNRIAFMNLLGEMGIPVVRYSPEELQEELKRFA